ncbi:DMT family transporter [Deinococcus yavapaiensis]|uniref:Transporter family-2 protein n=1 Tax=Deinococcus yavapaiensis KR-236 TaxID=694435 RepID=A0A318SCW0_9DEIO|nr:DMT family transporter [Deinococcus yavapaiensis]PYE55234.1 transporter family-2 protein [Deinococcus yavapaiensis KR-236]
MSSRWSLSAAVLVGLLLPVQFAVNSALTTRTNSPVATAAISYGVGTAALLLGLVVAHRGRVPLRQLSGAPAWSYFGGVIGSAYVVGSVVLTRTLGAALAVTLVIVAQTLTSLALDHFGALGLPRRPMNTTRVFVLVLVLAALTLQVL